MSSGARRHREVYGAPLRVSRRNGHELATMPWPQPCSFCGSAACWEVDGRRVCRKHLSEELRK